jgi:hypothetical protein
LYHTYQVQRWKCWWKIETSPPIQCQNTFIFQLPGSCSTQLYTKFFVENRWNPQISRKLSSLQVKDKYIVTLSFSYLVSPTMEWWRTSWVSCAAVIFLSLRSLFFTIAWCNSSWNHNKRWLSLSDQPLLISIVLRAIIQLIGLGWLMVFNTTYNISIISWRAVLLVEETKVPGKNHWPGASHWQTLSHNVVSNTRSPLS